MIRAGQSVFESVWGVLERCRGFWADVVGSGEGWGYSWGWSKVQSKVQSQGWSKGKLGIHMPLKNRGSGFSEMSHGPGRFAHPDSNFQTTTAAGSFLPFAPADRNGGSRRGGFTNEMLMETLKRSDPTNSLEFSGDYGPGGAEGLLEAKGNPDIFGPGPALVVGRAQRPRGSKRPPVLPNGVYRQT